MNTRFISLVGIFLVAGAVCPVQQKKHANKKMRRSMTQSDAKKCSISLSQQKALLFRGHIDKSCRFVDCLRDTLKVDTRGFLLWLGLGQENVVSAMVEEGILSQLFEKFPFDQLMGQVKTLALRDCLQEMQVSHCCDKLFAYWDALKQFDFSNTNNNQENTLFYTVFAQDLAVINQLNPEMTDIERSSIMAYESLKDFLCVVAILYQYCANETLIPTDSLLYDLINNLLSSQNIPIGDQADPVLASYATISSLPIDQIIDVINNFIELFAQSIERLAVNQDPVVKPFSLVDWVKDRVVLLTISASVFLVKITEYFCLKSSNNTSQE